MTTKKALALALCIALSIVYFGMISASAEPISGGWEFCDISAVNVSADEKAVFDKAIEGLAGVTYEIKDVIATQMVAGTNYAFLCKAAPVIPDPEPYWCIVNVYADLDGNAKLNSAASIDPANVSTMENISEPMMGAWSSAAKETGAPVPEKVKEALGNNTGVELSPIAVIGTQVVAGKNYRILAYGTLVTAEPRTDLYVVDVYEDLEGNASISSVNAFDLLSYIDLSPVDDSSDNNDTENTPDDNIIGSLDGGWAFYNVSVNNLSSSEKAVFDKALEGFVGVTLEPRDVIATQTVAGTNYAFLCTAVPVIPHAEYDWVIVKVYADLSGKATIESIKAIDASDVKTLDNIEDKGSGSWQSTAKTAAIPLEDEVQKALGENMGLSLSPIAVLGLQTVAGYNYRVLAYGTLVTAQPRTDLYVVDVYSDLNKNASITSISPLDLTYYLTNEALNNDVPDDTHYVRNSMAAPNTSSNTSSGISSDTSSDNGVKSPKTGTCDLFVFAAALMIVTFCGLACAASMKKRTN